MRGYIVAWAVVYATPLFAQWPAIQVQRLFTGVTQPTHVAAVPDGGGRLWVVEQAGRIRVARNGALAAAPVLDITSRVSCCGERGLLSVAFPPGFAAKRYFYVNYTNRAGNTVIARYRLTADDVADPASETVVLGVDQPFPNHNGGQLAFGPDGFLYIGMGDGGSGGDPLGNGQGLGTLLGKILRIDVESGTQPYAVPPSNPLVGRAGARGEIWAYGLRNPWRFSFDRATRDLYIADVGQNQWEEVNFQPAASRGGENYGWNIMEGAHCFGSAGCNQQGLVLPVAEYEHSQGCSVTGGFVYRGQRYPALGGIYFYADYCSGRIWGLRRAGAGWESQVLLETNLSISSFGEDEAGEIYIADQAGSAVFVLSGPAGDPAVTAVTNAASFQEGVTPGSIGAISGAGITRGTGVATAFPLPTSLAGTTVRVNGTPAPLFAVAEVGARQQINFQVPWSLAGTTSADLVVETVGLGATSMRASLLAVQPGLFTTDGARAAALHASDFALVDGNNPAAKGEIVLLYGTGFGAVENQPETGSATPVSPLSRTLAPVAVAIGGRSADVLFSGLAPGLAGVYQLNVRVPPEVPSGVLAVTATVGERLSPAVSLPVR